MKTANSFLLTLAGGAIFLGGPAAESATLTATFDSFSESIVGDSLTDGGIRFFNPDNYIPGEPGVFAIDRADGNLGGHPFFSSPNGLTMGGFSVGPIGGGFRFGAMSMQLADGGRASAVGMDLFINNLDGQNRLLLVAALDGTPVASTFITGPIVCCDTYRRIELAGVVFDSLRLIGTGGFESGAAFLLIDNVSIESIPLPAALWLLGSGLALLATEARRARMSAASAIRSCV